MKGIRRKLKGVVFRSVLEKNPTALKLARKVQFVAWEADLAVRRLFRNGDAEHDEILWVNPADIKDYIGDLPWSRFQMRGRTVAGDWDLEAVPFRGWDLYKAMQARFTEGVQWEDTPFYERVVDEIESGYVRWGCSTEAEFQQRLDRLEDLYHEIAENGYKSQEEVHSDGTDQYSWESDSPFNTHDEVTVCIDRNGRILLRDGKHRLSIAKILGLEAIPVVVGLRHAKWNHFRDELQAWVDARGGSSYQPYTHPDLQNIPAQHDDGRVKLIRKHLEKQDFQFEGKRLLDIGSYFGYFCHSFEALGASCTAVEIHPKHLYFMKRLREAQGRSFDIWDHSILDVKDVPRFDIVLAMNIFHHFLKTEESREALIRVLGRLDTDFMFFEPHHPDDSVMQNAFANPSPQEFVDFVLEHSCLTRATKLATVTRGRELFVLER